MKKIFSILFCMATLSVSGCSTFNDEFTCGEFPESGCQPISVVYNRTNDGVYDYRSELFAAENQEKKEREAKKFKALNKNNSEDGSGNIIKVSAAYNTLNYAAPGDPILTKPLVVRVLINSWVDKDKDLNSGGYIYMRVRDGKWVVNK